MEYRKFEKLNINTSLLGFGCMRFPTLQDGSIDEAIAEKMIDYAYQNKVNYFDTAYPYHDGKSELFVGKCLDKYPRESYFLATKMPMWKLENLDDAKKIFNEQLNKLNKTYVDFYLIHALNRDRWEMAKKIKLFEYLEELKKEGKIKYIGFSFHDSYEVFEEIIKDKPWDFCQIQFNYMDTLVQAGLKGYELAEKLGIPMVIMEPIKGGSLAKLPKDINQIFLNYDASKSTSSWALRYVGTFSNVKVILSGMSNEDHVKDNINTFKNFKPLNNDELVLIEKVVESLNARVKNGCTRCRYCMPCPFGVDIPFNFTIWNEFGKYENLNDALENYNYLVDNKKDASVCHACHLCETKCPQKISIVEDLIKIKELFGNKN